MSETVIEKLEKDPDAREPFAIDWVDWLDGQSIATSQWIIESGLNSDSPSVNGTKAIIYLSGGRRGKTYRVTNRITTSAPVRGTDQSFDLEIIER